MDNLGKFNEAYEKRLLKLKYRQYYVTKNKSKSRMEDMDILIEKANIRRYIPIISSEVVIAISIIMGIAAFIIVLRMLYNIFAGIIVGVFIYLTPKHILTFIAYRNAEKVDKQLIFFINIMENFCHIIDDITYAIEKSIPYLREPLKTYSITFISEVKHGISVFDALEHLKEKVNNRKFKMLMKNLRLCVKYKGSFVQVLTKTKESMKKHSIERDRRKKSVSQHRMTILVMILVIITLDYGLVKMNPSLSLLLKKDLIGQLIVVYNIFAIIFAIYKTLTLEQYEY